MYISGNGEVYEDEEVFDILNRNNSDYYNDINEDEEDFQNIEDVIVSWETRLGSRF